MRKLIYLSVIIVSIIICFSFVSAYTPPEYTNVTIVLDSSYTPPTYTNVTIVLGEEAVPPAPEECWTQTDNIIYIPNRCVYDKLNGES